MQKIERTFVMLKPDAVFRGLIGEIISRLEKKGLKIISMKMLKMDRELAEKHYNIHKNKPFFAELVEFITSGPVVVMVIEGPFAIEEVRKLVGATAPQDAQPGTIRGDLATKITFNLIHASDSPETAKSEISNFFAKEEIVDYERADESWV